MIAKRLARGIDDRLGTSKFGRSALNKVFPDHWSFLLGEIALYAFLVLVVTGVFLTFFFVPDLKQVTYHGSYAPLDGTTMSAAYRSTVDLSFDVRAGLVMRQMHHWAALVFLAAIVVHLCRIFFTGAFRRPREVNWVIGVTMLLLALGNGFAGYSMPDDLLSGTGLRIAYSVVLSIPVIGTWLAFLLFGGPFPSDQIVGRLYIIHVLLVPAALAVLISVHLAIVWRQKHTQFPGPGHREDNVVGTRLWPAYAAKSVGLLFLTAGVIAGLGGLAQINPVWLWGPYEPAAVTTAAQPDWYVGFLEGALRLAPPWDLTLWGHTVPELFLPGVVLPGLTFALLYAWPWIEKRRTHDDADHNLLDRPRDRPVRTAIGVGVLSFYVLLTVAGGQDIISQHLHLPIAEVTWFLRIAVVVVPLVAGYLAFRICQDLAAGDRGDQPPESDADDTDGRAPDPSDGVNVDAGASPEASHQAKEPTPTTSAATPP